MQAQTIKVVSLGKDGALSRQQRRLPKHESAGTPRNRKIGKDHMTLPTVATESKTTEPIQFASLRNSGPFRSVVTSDVGTMER